MVLASKIYLQLFSWIIVLEWNGAEQLLISIRSEWEQPKLASWQHPTYFFHLPCSPLATKVYPLLAEYPVNSLKPETFDSYATRDKDPVHICISSFPSAHSSPTYISCHPNRLRLSCYPTPVTFSFTPLSFPSLRVPAFVARK